MTSIDLAAAFAKAAEIAKGVPDNLQQIAFQRALDALLASGTPAAASTPSTSQRAATSRTSATSSGAPESPDTPNRAARLIQVIDRTEGARIISTGRVLDKALLVLRAAHRNGITALTPGEIAQVLTDKFRERTSAPAVRMALGGDDSFTDRTPEGTGFVYKLMAPGERHLEALEGGAPLPTRAKARSRPPRSPKAPTNARPSPGTPAKPTKPSSGKAARSGRPGPKAMLEALISQGYFDSQHSVGEVIDHLQSKRGHRYKATDLSPALGRLLREEKLDRDRDDNGQYRYVRKG